MSSMTLVESSKLSRNPLFNSIARAIVTTDELIARIPMVGKKGESFVYNREKSLPAMPFIEMTDSLEESSPDWDKVTVPMRIMGGNTDIYNFAEEQQDDVFDMRAAYLVKKAKAAGREIGQKLITGAYATGFTLSPQPAGWAGPYIDALVSGPGLDSSRHGPGTIKYVHASTSLQFRAPGDVEFGPLVLATADGVYVLPSSNPSRWVQVTLDVSDANANGEYNITFQSTSKQWDGLKKLMSTNQIIASTNADGDPFTFGVLDRLIDEKVKVKENLHFITNGKIKAKIYNSLRNLGGTTPGDLALPGMAYAVPQYRGIPILQSDWITSDEAKGAKTNLSSIYLVSLSAEEGFWMGVGGGSFNVDTDPMQRTVMGLRVREVGQLEDKDAHRTRVTFYGAPALGSDLAAARASEIQTD